MTARQDVADDFGRAGGLPDAVAALLLDYELTEAECASVNPFWLLDLEFPVHRDGCPTWEAHKAVLLPHFVKRNPGRRPSRWWTYDAPEKTRLRLDGVGTESWFSGAPRCGIPKFVTAEDAEWLTDVSPIDPKNPPTFESQATYLERHGLLSAHERRRLPADAFAPEAVG